MHSLICGMPQQARLRPHLVQDGMDGRDAAVLVAHDPRVAGVEAVGGRHRERRHRNLADLRQLREGRHLRRRQQHRHGRGCTSRRGVHLHHEQTHGGRHLRDRRCERGRHNRRRVGVDGPARRERPLRQVGHGARVVDLVQVAGAQPGAERLRRAARAVDQVARLGRVRQVRIGQVRGGQEAAGGLQRGPVGGGRGRGRGGGAGAQQAGCVLQAGRVLGPQRVRT